MEKRVERIIQEDKTITKEMNELKKKIKSADTISALFLLNREIVILSEKKDWKFLWFQKEYMKKKRVLKKFIGN